MEMEVQPTKWANGIVEDLSMDLYRRTAAVAASDLKNMQRSPAFARMRSHSTSPAKEWGTAVHTAILEPDMLDARYRVEPAQPADNDAKVWRATKLYKEGVAALMAEPGVEGVLSADDMESLRWVQQRVKENAIGAQLHEIGGIREGSVFCHDDEFRVWRKVRPDWLIPQTGVVIDVKTGADHRPRQFARACHAYGYHLSAAYYLDTLTAALDQSFDHYVFLVVNSDAPHEVATYTLDADSIEQGRHEYRRALAHWRECEETGRWPGGSSKIEELRLPEYAINFHKLEENF